jgi:hypothetical protein
MAKSKRVVQATGKRNKANALKRAKVIQQNYEVLKKLHE